MLWRAWAASMLPVLPDGLPIRLRFYGGRTRRRLQGQREQADGYCTGQPNVQRQLLSFFELDMIGPGSERAPAQFHTDNPSFSVFFKAKIVRISVTVQDKIECPSRAGFLPCTYPSRCGRLNSSAGIPS